MATADFARIATIRGVEQFRNCLAELGADLPCDDAPLAAPHSPLAQPLDVLGRRVTNRFAVQPMEGWDGTPDGRPTENTVRRWRRFGSSGAGLVWGGEAVAVRHEGRANPNQLVLRPETASDLGRLRGELLAAHRAATDGAPPPIVGLQLTHSGRYCRPNPGGRPEPRIAFRHPLLDRRLGLGPDYPVMTDAELDDLVGDFARAAALAAECGFDFVDLKHCHGYLGHELLGAHTRPGPYGGPLRNRARFLRLAAAAIGRDAPALGIGVRLSAFDTVPFHPDPDQSAPGRPGPGVPEIYCDTMPYRYGFGVDADQPVEPDLAEPAQFLDILRELGITLVNVTGGSPYYNPHIQRPALYPPSDGYGPPEDPLVGVARHLHVTRTLKELAPDMVLVGTGYTYLQEYLPHVAQAAVRARWTDLVGVGRLVLAYPELPADLLAGRELQTKRVCRTFSDCTTAPRAGLPSGCYPLDPHYKRSPEAARLAEAKRGGRPERRVAPEPERASGDTPGGADRL
ncbi:MAG: NADH:flavin oxidoreductase [Chthonomonadales bacterium]|nr:NADH:flavin oxidoreductase [Chthonomonadales bacterium]